MHDSKNKKTENLINLIALKLCLLISVEFEKKDYTK